MAVMDRYHLRNFEKDASFESALIDRTEKSGNLADDMIMVVTAIGNFDCLGQFGQEKDLSWKECAQRMSMKCWLFTAN